MICVTEHAEVFKSFLTCTSQRAHFYTQIPVSKSRLQTPGVKLES